MVNNNSWALRRPLIRNQHQNKHSWNKLLTDTSQYIVTASLSQIHVNSLVHRVWFCCTRTQRFLCSHSLLTAKVDKPMKIQKQGLDPEWESIFRSPTSLFSFHNNVVPQLHTANCMQMTVNAVQWLQLWMPGSSLARELNELLKGKRSHRAPVQLSLGFLPAAEVVVKLRAAQSV